MLLYTSFVNTVANGVLYGMNIWLILMLYIVVNIFGIIGLYRYLRPRMNNDLLSVLFSVSLSLGITFLLVLLSLSFFLKHLHTF